MAGSIIVGIDPGPKQSGLAVIDADHILNADIYPNGEILPLILTWRNKGAFLVVEDFLPTQRPFANDHLDTILWIHGRGGIDWTWGTERAHYVNRKVIQSRCRKTLAAHCRTIGDRDGAALAGIDPANKVVRSAMLARWGKERTRAIKDHAWSALAIATWWMDVKQMPQHKED